MVICVVTHLVRLAFFTLLMMPFNEPKFLLLTSSSLSIFSFIPGAFRKLPDWEVCLAQGHEDFLLDYLLEALVFYLSWLYKASRIRSRTGRDTGQASRVPGLCRWPSRFPENSILSPLLRVPLSHKSSIQKGMDLFLSSLACFILIFFYNLFSLSVIFSPSFPILGHFLFLSLLLKQVYKELF